MIRLEEQPFDAEVNLRIFVRIKVTERKHNDLINGLNQSNHRLLILKLT